MKGKAALIARFKPLHIGSALMLDAVCRNYDFVYIGIGSSNKPLSATNPFTPEESTEMVNLFLGYAGHNNFQTFDMPDFAHLGPEHRDGLSWKKHLSETLESFGGIDYFVTGNSWVKEILEDTYTIIHPSAMVESKYHVPVKASMVRIAIAKNDDWQSLVPGCIAQYIHDNSLDERLRQMFGKEILENESMMPDTLLQEKEKTYR
jgi:nicotinamide-nucleotide adenylyltransferase